MSDALERWLAGIIIPIFAGFFYCFMGVMAIAGALTSEYAPLNFKILLLFAGTCGLIMSPMWIVLAYQVYKDK